MLLTGMGQIDNYLQFMTVLILFVFVLGITYVATRWIANYQKGKAAGSNLELIEAMPIANNKYLQIVRAGNKYLVIAIGKDEVHMLTELSQDEIKRLEENESQMDFKSILEKLKRQSAKDDD